MIDEKKANEPGFYPVVVMTWKDGERGENRGEICPWSISSFQIGLLSIFVESLSARLRGFGKLGKSFSDFSHSKQFCKT